jgi:ribosomal protein L11 methyltransferase
MASSPRGAIDIEIEIAPRWRIVAAPRAEREGELQLVIDPGPGFGDGLHETTQLCLQAIAALAPRKREWRMLDFGSGSGILGIGAAKLGGVVDAVEIDPRAIDHAERNARVNAVSDRIRQARMLEDMRGPFDLVVANILRTVLLEHARALVSGLAIGGTLVLSGLVSTDVAPVSAGFAALLGGRRPEVYERGEWRAVVWRAASPSAPARLFPV